MSSSKSSFHTTTKIVRGTGAAHEGTHHFWIQRVSALALIPLSIWFMMEVMTTILGANRSAIAVVFKAPHVALLMSAFVVAMVVHARIGVLEIITDYVHCECKKIALILLNNAAALLIVSASLFAIARLHFLGM